MSTSATALAQQAPAPREAGDGAALYFVLDTLVAARAVYGFVRAYFHARFERQSLRAAAAAGDDVGGGGGGHDNKEATHGLGSTKTEAAGAGARGFGDPAGGRGSSGRSGTDSVASSSTSSTTTATAGWPQQHDQRLQAQGHHHHQQQQPRQKKPIRVYMDGCFDSMHFGHANALRQAKALGDVLVVGLNPEVEIRKHKGPPVMSDRERYVAVSSVKWVDQVLTNVPYEVSPEFLDTLIHEHNIDVIVHGDDPCIGADGQDVYKAVKEAGRFRTIKRTEGVSSTDIVGRMLLCTRGHHLDHLGHPAPSSTPVGDHPQQPPPQPPPHTKKQPPAESATLDASPTSVAHRTSGEDAAPSRQTPSSTSSPFTRVSTFLPTTRRLIQFAGGPKAPAPGDRVVYCDGTFDMFHAGHIETLRAARALGEFLLVGIHDDATVNVHKGSNFPIMNLHERTLSVLSCKYVDEVIIGAPWCVTNDMITTMNISIVVHGTHHDPSAETLRVDPYALPKRLGIYKEVVSVSNLTVHEILDRIVRNRSAYVERNAKKEQSEQDYLTKYKTYVPEV